MEVAAQVPGLLLRFGYQFLRFESKRKKAVKAFRKELRAQNIDKEPADLLTREYESAGSIRTLMGQLSTGGFLDFVKLS